MVVILHQHVRMCAQEATPTDKEARLRFAAHLAFAITRLNLGVPKLHDPLVDGKLDAPPVILSVVVTFGVLCVVAAQLISVCLQEYLSRSMLGYLPYMCPWFAVAHKPSHLIAG
jgi:hypothetical protein